MPRRRPIPATDPRRAVAYVHTSEPDAASRCERWCTREQVEMAALFTEPQCASPLDKREVLADALAAVETLGAGVFLTPRRDTLATTAVTYALAQRVVERSGAQWRTVEPPPVPFESDLVQQVRAALISHETMVYRPAVRAGRERRRQAGRHSGGAAPWGFQVQEGELVENPEERAAIQEMLRMREAGATYQHLADWLGRQDFSGRGPKIYPATVRRVLEAVRNSDGSGRPAPQKRKP
jgi:DNA invertase Pin-like site-specific DNA recombinase